MKIIGGPGGGYSTTPVLDYFREKGIGMSEQTKVVVPEGMMAAVLEADPCVAGHEGIAKHHIETALLWQKDNPRVPSEDQERSLDEAWLESRKNMFAPYHQCAHATAFGAIEWQRRMYDAPKSDSDPSTESMQKLSEQDLVEWIHQMQDELRRAETACLGIHLPIQNIPQSLLDLREIEEHNARCEEFLKRDREAKAFDGVFRFSAILERPATKADEPISEREKQQGIRENVTCVRAEDYSRLLVAYQELLPKHQSKTEAEDVQGIHSEREVPPEIADLVAGWAGSRLEICMNALAIAAWRRGKGLPDFESDKPVDF